MPDLQRFFVAWEADALPTELFPLCSIAWRFNTLAMRRSGPSLQRKLQLFDHVVERMLRVTG